MFAQVSLRKCTPSLFSSTVSHSSKCNFSTSTILDRYYKLTQAYKAEQDKRKQRLSALKELNIDPKIRLVKEYYQNKKLEKKKLAPTNYAAIAEQKPTSRILNLLLERIALNVDEIYTAIQEQFPEILKSKNHLRHILTQMRLKKMVKTVAPGHKENHLYCLTFSQQKRMKDRKEKMQNLGQDVESLVKEAQALTIGDYAAESVQHAKAE